MEKDKLLNEEELETVSGGEFHHNCPEGKNITESTKEKMKVDIYSQCHPFYTGTQNKIKKTGNIEKFNRKYGLNKETKAN